MWKAANLSDAIGEVVNHFGISMGKLGQPVRIAITSGPVWPTIDVTLELVESIRAKERLKRAIDFVTLLADSE